jgi:galactonate dehydratase
MLEKMKITDIKIFVVDAFRTNWTFIKVETDGAPHGWGEASLGTQEAALSGCVSDLKRLIIGRNPLEIEKMRFEIYRDIYWKGGPVLMSALSGVEMALWDIAGKYFNAPVHALLGGKMRDRVRIYANAWFTGARTPEDFAAKAKETAALGVTAIKWDPFGKAHLTISHGELDLAARTVGAVRDAVGPDTDLLIECHGRFNPRTALLIAEELAQFKPMLMEEPCPPDNFDASAEVRARSPVPISGGERVYTKFGFKDYFGRKAVDIAQPDIFHCGGIMEAKIIAGMAEANHIPVSFHNPSGPVSNAAALQLAACVPNFLIHEIMLTDGSFRKDLSDEEIVYDAGHVMIPDKPGLGIEMREDEMLKRPCQPRNLRHYNGTLTDIRRKDDCVCYFKGIGQ